MSPLFEQVLRGVRLFVAVIVAGFHVLVGGSVVTTTPLPAPQATSTPASVPATLASAPAESPTITPAQTTTQKPKVAEKTPEATPPTPKAAAAPAVDQTELNQEVRKAVVNILCVLSTDTSVRTISGSGVFIDTRGVILTNAHVAQYFLLHDYPAPNATRCTIRTGSPAQAAYAATLLFLPPQWIKQNASQITSTEPSGTGESDYAFVLVSDPEEAGNPFPSSFPAISMSNATPEIGSTILLSAYAAGFFGSLTIATNLYNTSAFSTLQHYYTFATSSIDAVSLGGSVAAQAGSSGGAAVDAYTGDMIGLITSDTASSTTAGRDLRAITIDYIDRSLTQDRFGGIRGLLKSDPRDIAQVFGATIAPTLKAQLVAALEKH